MASVIARIIEPTASESLDANQSIEIIASFSVEPRRRSARGKRILSHQGIPDLTGFRLSSFVSNLIAGPLPRIILCRQPGNGGFCVRRASLLTRRWRPDQKKAFQCAPAESDALLKGSRFMERPCSPFRASRGVFSCGVRDLSDRGAGVRLNDLPLLPTEFDISIDGFRTTLACLMWRDGDIAGIAFRPTATGKEQL